MLTSDTALVFKDAPGAANAVFRPAPAFRAANAAARRRARERRLPPSPRLPRALHIDHY